MKKSLTNYRSETKTSAYLLSQLNQLSENENFTAAFEDKKFEFLDTHNTKIERERYRNKLEQNKKQIEEYMVNIDKSTSKNTVREHELRNYISSLSQRVHCKDVDQIKSSMDNLYGQILKNIATIDTKMKVEITEKKKDIENRISIRLMDSEYRHKMVLDDKVREQEGMLRSLHSITQEMSRIKENYLKIRKRIENYSNSNVEYNRKLALETIRNKKLKITLKHYKILIKELMSRVEEKNGFKKEHINSANSATKNKTQLNGLPRLSGVTGLNVQRISSANTFYHKDRKDRQDQQSEAGYISARTLKGDTAIKSHLPNDIPGQEDNNILDKYPKIRKTVELLSNTLNTLKNKTSKMQREYNDLITGKSVIEEQVANIICALKTNDSVNLTQMPVREIYNSLEDRKKFIEMVVTDPELRGIYNDEKFPTINVACRVVNSVK